jgi:seryl-tRNA synthetase
MSVVKELVGKIARRLDAAKQKRESDYDALVRKIADGKEPPLETVEATLQGAGKTAADLEAAVELLVERRRLRAIADKLPALESEAAALQVKAGKANAILEAAEQEHARAIHPIQCRLEEIAQARYAAQSAVTELRRIYRGPEVTERSAAINARLNDLRNRRVRLDVDRSRLQAELDRLNARIRLGGDAQFIASCRHDAAELEKGIARFSQELADNEAESARLVSEQDGLVKQMIEV